MIFLGFLWAIFAPLSLVAGAALLAFVIRSIAPDLFGFWSAFALAATLVLAPVYWVWRQDMTVFKAVCSDEGAPRIFEKAVTDGMLLTSGTSNSFGMRYLHDEGFQWMESDDIYNRGGFVRYARDDKGAISTTKIDAPTARYEVREIFEQRPPELNISRTLVIDRQTGKEMARAASVTFNGGRMKWLLGAWGTTDCPSAASDSAGFRAWYHLAKNTLR